MTKHPKGFMQFQLDDGSFSEPVHKPKFSRHDFSKELELGCYVKAVKDFPIYIGTQEGYRQAAYIRKGMKGIVTGFTDEGVPVVHVLIYRSYFALPEFYGCWKVDDASR